MEERAVRSEPRSEDPFPPPPGGWEALRRVQGLFLAFVNAALIITLVAGTGLGAMLLGHRMAGKGFDLALAEVHAHSQLFGFVTMMVLGVSVFALPRFTKVNYQSMTLLWGIFWGMLVGVVLRVVGQPMVPAPGRAGELMVWLSAWLELFALGGFVYLISRLSPRTGKLSIAEVFNIFAYLYLLAAAVVNLFSVAGIVVLGNESGFALAPHRLERAIFFLMLWGFGLAIVVGVGGRMLPPLIRVSPNLPLLRIAFFFHLVGVVMSAAWEGRAYLIGAGFIFIASLMVSLGLGVWQRGEGVREVPGSHPIFPLYIRAAFVWLVVAALLNLLASFGEPGQGVLGTHNFMSGMWHALGIGFILTMIAGMGARILPAFAGRRFGYWGWMVAVFWLIQIGVVLRVAGEVMTPLTPRGSLLAGISGVLHLVAVLIWILLLWLAFVRGRRLAEAVGRS